MWAWLNKKYIKQPDTDTDTVPAIKTKKNKSTLRTYKPKATRQLEGARAEKIAQAYLLEKGLKAINANVACAQGEIDLVMLDGKTLVFVEVRWRKSHAYGGAVVSITPRKISKLSHACQMFLLHEPTWRAHPCRIDVLALQGDLNAPNIEWLKNVTG